MNLEKKKIGKRKIFVFAVVTILGATFLAVLTAEILARFFYSGPLVTNSLIVSDDNLAFSLRKGVECNGVSPEFTTHYAVDTKYGFRVSTASEMLPDHPDIIIYGDSFVFGHGVDYDKIFTSLLSNKFPEFTIINAGVFNYGPDQEFLLARRLRKTATPKMEIACFFTGNDFTDFGRFKILQFSADKISVGKPDDPAGNTRRTLSGLFFYPWLCQFYSWHLFKAVVIERRFRSAVPAKEKKEEELSAAEKKKIYNIAKMYSIWRKEANNHFLLVLFPDQNFFTGKNRRFILLKRYLTDMRVNFLDLSEKADDNKKIFRAMYYPIDGHWNSKGHVWAAKNITKAIRNLNDQYKKLN
jgi:hypothetical protein